MKINNKIINILFVVLIFLLVVGFTVKNNQLVEVQGQLNDVQEQFNRYKINTQIINDELNLKNAQLGDAIITISNLKNEEYELVYVGDFKITYYCDERYDHICGGNGVTASGKPTEVGVTAAADWSVLPKGSQIYIQDVGWREVQDIGGGVNGEHVDVLVRSHQEALNLGTHSEGVWLLVKKS